MRKKLRNLAIILQKLQLRGTIPNRPTWHCLYFEKSTPDVKIIILFYWRIFPSPLWEQCILFKDRNLGARITDTHSFALTHFHLEHALTHFHLEHALTDLHWQYTIFLVPFRIVWHLHYVSSQTVYSCIWTILVLIM